MQLSKIILKNVNVSLCNLRKYGATIDRKLSMSPCVVHGNYDLVVLLTEHGANVNVDVGYYGTPLEVACEYGHCDIYDYLITHGAKPTEKCLYNACKSLHIDIVTRLLHDNVPIVKSNRSGNPLIAACEHKTPNMHMDMT